MLLLLLMAAQPGKRPADHVKGRQVYDRSCWQCHGDTMAGDGPAAAALIDGVPDLRDVLDYSERDALIESILDGQGDMPAFKAEFDKNDARRVLIYMERLEKGQDQPSVLGEKPADAAKKKPETPGDEEEPSDGPEGGI